MLIATVATGIKFSSSCSPNTCQFNALKCILLEVVLCKANTGYLLVCGTHGSPSCRIFADSYTSFIEASLLFYKFRIVEQQLALGMA